jgi:hypothetical protein
MKLADVWLNYKKGACTYAYLFCLVQDLGAGLGT